MATGVPPPEITWHCFQKIIKPDEETFETAGEYTSKLTVKSGEDVGECSCIVKNKYSEPIQHSFAESEHKPITEGESIRVVLCSPAYLLPACSAQTEVCTHLLHIHSKK